MWAAVIEVDLPKGFGRGAGGRVERAVRYAGVLAVWVGLAVIRPGLALAILRERRADSPLRRGSWPSGLTADSQRRILANRL
jgi:hypothetical protein